MPRKKETQQKDDCKLIMPVELRPCTVVLHDIALDTDLIQRYQFHLPSRKEELSKQSHCSTSIDSTNKQLIKKNVKKKNSKENGRCKTTKSSNKKTTGKKRKDNKKAKSQQNSKDIEINKNVSLNQEYDETTPSEFIAQIQQLTHTNVTSLSSKSTDETSSTTTNTHFNYMQKMAVLMNNKNNKNVNESNVERKNRSRSKRAVHLDNPDVIDDPNKKSAKVGSNDANCLDKKNLTIIDYISSTQEISSKPVTHMQCNNNLHPVNFSDGISCKVKQERCKRNKNTKDSIVQTTCNEGKSARKETKKSVIRRSLPKIIGNFVLPKEMQFSKSVVRVEKLSLNNSLQNNISNQISLEQNTFNTNDNNSDQTLHIKDIAKTTNIKEREYHAFLETNGSIKTLRSSSPLNNNFELKDNLPTNKSHKNLKSLTKVRNNSYIDINDINSETKITHENHTLNLQEQLNKFNIDVYEHNALQENKNKDTSDLMDVDDDSTTSLISASKDITIKQTLKRPLEKEKNKDCDLGNKRLKLNRSNWLQNNITSTKTSHQQCGDSPSTVTTNTTVETNMFKEPILEDKLDLRKRLEQIRLERSFRLKSTVETKNKEVCKQSFGKEESASNETLYEKKSIVQEERTSVINDDDDDCISLFAESFAEFDASMQCEEKVLCEKDKSCKSLHSDIPCEEDKLHKSLHSDISCEKDISYKSLQSDIPYTLTASSFDKYVKQNNTEFNKEYAECIENNNIEVSDSNKANEISNNQSTQALNTNCIPATAIEKSVQIGNMYQKQKSLLDFIKGHCYNKLRFGTCHLYKQMYYMNKCKYNHDMEILFQAVYSEDSKTILNLISDALKQNFYYFCETVYIASFEKLTVEEILLTYKTFHIGSNFNLRGFILPAKKNIVYNIIKELSLNRQIPLKIIIDYMMRYVLPNNLHEAYNILTVVGEFVNAGEYWNTVRNTVLKLLSNNIFCQSIIIDKILHDCIKSKDSQNIQDVNSNLINKLDFNTISTLDKNAMKCFKDMLATTNSYLKASTQSFGKSLTTTGTIASPDSPDPNQTMNYMQQESPTRYDVTSNSETNADQSENNVTQDGNLTKPYKFGFLQTIDAPFAQSIYRDHEHFWKFYMDLERFERGLKYEDYDYVIDILKSYTEKRESELFISKCSLILRRIKRSDYHLKNILRLTVQMGTFNSLGKILFDIGLDVLVNLVDEEAWGLALQLIQSLNIYDLPYNAEYFLLSAEIYLANKKAVKACNLLKYQNIICTSRDNWHVKSTINDEHVRKKVMCLLLDSFCNESLEYAFFLFEFLLKDQSSYYDPIDLSRYTDKLIILSLSKNNTSLIIEMCNLVLKHCFALSTTTYRALLSTIIYTDEVLARQIYNYAEGMGVYSAVKTMPIIYIIINTDLTEEEIYLKFLQLLKNLVMNFGHAIEFAKPQQSKVYFILEIKTNKQFYCAALQSKYNNKTISNAKALIRSVLKKRFDPPILLMRSNVKSRIGKLQGKSLINYLKSEHCN